MDAEVEPEHLLKYLFNSVGYNTKFCVERYSHTLGKNSIKTNHIPNRIRIESFDILLNLRQFKLRYWLVKTAKMLTLTIDLIMVIENQIIGAIPALRGFRKQFLHTLHRIIDANNEVIYPETLEDFAVYNNAGKLLEIVQVKDHKEPLTFSELSSFFHRAAKHLKEHPDANIILASYGKLGSELNNYIGADEIKIKKKKKFNTPDLRKVFSRISFVQLNEKDETNSIKQFLTKFPMTIGDWQAAYDLLMQHLYRGAEEGAAYTREKLVEHLQSIGQYLVKREAHHNEWGVTITPLIYHEAENKEQLREGFYEGIAVRWRHICADLDIIRDKHLKAIRKKFRETNIVIIHGASGQGKSALAYRYLNDYCPPATRYEIKDLSTKQRALEIATALAGYQVPLTFYIDATHKDKGVPDFLRFIADLSHIDCLVTIREEDWQLIGLTSTDLRFSDLELCFNREEAKELYVSWEKNYSSHFPDFEQAWAHFEEEGPLLEFVHLLTHTQSLRDRLQGQYKRIADEIDCHQRSEYDLKLIKYVATAGAYGARIDLSKLASNTALKQSISRLEKEYLLRVSDDNRHLIGLHKVRSFTLVSIFTDPILDSWDSLAIECLPFIEDADLEVFLLNSFFSHPEAYEQFFKYSSETRFKTWTAFGGVFRAHLWMGINQYVQSNENVIKKVYGEAGDGWWIMLDFDFLGLMDKSSNPSGIMDFLPEQRQKKIEKWRNLQTPKTQIFLRINQWLQNIKIPPMPSISSEREWIEIGKFAYWISFLKHNMLLYDHIDWMSLNETIENLPLESAATLIYGLWHAFRDINPFSQWYNEIRPLLLDRYRKEINAPYIEEQEMTMRAHFIVPLEDDKANHQEVSDNIEKNRFHSLALRNLKLLAQVIPDCTGYGCQGYGHQIYDFFENDDTTKSKIAAINLTPDWVTHINKTARILAGHIFRPPTWMKYTEKVMRIRTDAVQLIGNLINKLEMHFRKKGPVVQLIELLDNSHWKEYIQQINKIPGLPIEALDPWGYTEESSKIHPYESNSNFKNESIISAYLLRYQLYLQAKKNFFQSLNNFFSQSPNLIMKNTYLGKAKTIEDRRRIEQKIRELGLEMDRPFLPGYNLGEALNILSIFQRYYREHFVGLSDEKELSQLESKESKTLLVLWALWYLFTNEPARHLDMPGKVALAQFQSRIQSHRKKLKNTILKASTEEVHYRILDTSIQFEHKRSLWIAADSENPTNAYSGIESIFSSIYKSLTNIKLHSLEYFALEHEWGNFIVIPLCRGKLIEKNAWVIPVYQFNRELNTEGRLSSVDLVPRPIDSNIINRLKLRLWNPAELKDPKEFFQRLATLQLRLKHLVEIGNIPDSDELGTEIIQSYFNQLNEKISKDLELIIDKVQILISHFKQMNESSCGTFDANEYLKMAGELLDDIFSKLIPDGLDEGQVRLNNESLKIWQENISSIQVEGFMIYLLWCGHLISKS